MDTQIIGHNKGQPVTRADALNGYRAKVKAARIAEEAEEVADLISLVDLQETRAFWLFVDNEYGLEEPLAGQVDLAEASAMVLRFEDAYGGEWESEGAYIEDAIEEGLFGEASDTTLGRYIDVESLTRDVFMSDMYSLPVGKGRAVYVFWNM
jgi:predicted nucleotidyltransferase